MPARDHERDAVLALLRRHGRETTSFQALEPGLAYWFDEGGEACVAYADTGSAWVSVGAPIAPAAREDEVVARFAEAARARGRRVRFFGVERGDFGGSGLVRLHIGEQPFWDPRRWPEALRRKRSLREQLRRARAKGVTVRCLAAGELRDPDSPARRDIDALVARWQDSREMAPMGFVVQVELDAMAAERRVFVAERDGRVLGLLAAVPIYARQGWFFEDVLRRPEAPNGTIELLFDHALRALAEEGCGYVSYGLAPLAHTPSRALRWIRDRTRWLYHFDGLRAFKAKLVPDGWQPVYLAHPRGERGGRAVVDTLAAFAHGSFARFGLATLRHRAARVVRVLALLLLPWTAALALADSGRWFPSPGVRVGWIGFDLVLFGMLMALAARWRKPLAVILSLAAGLDFALGAVQAAVHNIPRARGVVDGMVIAAALAAPLFASVFLWLSRDRDSLYDPARTRAATADQARAST